MAYYGNCKRVFMAGTGLLFIYIKMHFGAIFERVFQ